MYLRVNYNEMESDVQSFLNAEKTAVNSNVYDTDIEKVKQKCRQERK